MALDLVVSGATGRMGRALARLIQEAEDLRALGGIAPDAAGTGQDAAGFPEILEVRDSEELVRRAEVIIDFSAPDHLSQLLTHCAGALAGRALLVGTTGLDQSLEQRLRDLSESAAVLVAPNFSVGLNVLLGLVEQAARALPADRYDIEIVETHHGRKDDAPSGTALALGKAAAKGRAEDLEPLRRDGRSGRTGERPTGEIGFHALRGGDVAGEHIVHLLGGRERMSLAHTAMDRDLFADGALVAARWMAVREPGWYGMTDVLGLSQES